MTTSRQPNAAPPSGGPTGWRTPWLALPLVAALVFLVSATIAAVRETPTVDEFAHVPAGLLSLRRGEFELYRNNPPLAKMWLAAPLALDPSVKTLEYSGKGTGWEPWTYGQKFEQQHRDNYLSLMVRARLMNLPLVLLGGAIVYFWSRSLFGALAGAVSSSLFLLSPTVLAHGHLATVDIASAVTIVGAVYLLRWSGVSPGWRRQAVAGAALGLALAVKFSALYLPPLMAVLWLAVVLTSAGPKPSWSILAGRFAVYVAVAWLTLNASMVFQGSLDTVGSLKLTSKSMTHIVNRLPASMPLLLPRAYVTGVDALQYDIETGSFPGYLHGHWTAGLKRYYFVAFAIKESETVVLLTVASLIALFLARLPKLELLLLAAPPAAFLFMAAVVNPLCLGIRYILPVYGFVFVAIGSVVTLGERWLLQCAKISHTGRFDRRWFMAGPLIGYAIALCLTVCPSYISYFNWFVGGPAHGSAWLIDSNLDWGQDLYRLPKLSAKYGVDRWQLLYFGHVDPRLYNLHTDLPAARPVRGFYAVSVNYWKGMPYAVLNENGEPDYISKRIHWVEPMIPTEIAGSLAIFDLREKPLATTNTPEEAFNGGMFRLVSGQSVAAIDFFSRATELRPDWANPYLYQGMAYQATGQSALAISSTRRAVELSPTWDLALNNLAWLLASDPMGSDHVRREAVKLAELAVQLSNRSNYTYLSTLVTAYSADGQPAAAIQVCNEVIGKAPEKAVVEEFQQLRAEIEAKRK